MEPIGEDIREKLHKLPVHYAVHQHVHPKCVWQRCHDGVVMPQGSDNGLKADITVVADVVVQKYAEHKPLYRQQQACEQIRIPLRLDRVVRAVRENILRQQYVQSDETSVRMQMADEAMQMARLWSFGLPWAEVVFDFRTNNSHHGPQEWLMGRQPGTCGPTGAAPTDPCLSI